MAKFPGILGRPRALAGGTLGLAGVATGLVLALGGTAATAPSAFAVTRSSDGAVQVELNYLSNQNLPQVNAKLAAMGTGEAVRLDMASGPATASGPVRCTPAPRVSGPTLKVLVGANGTETIGAGQSAGNTAEGTFHLAACTAVSSSASGNSGAG
jgi:hypothetical protein